MRLTLKLHPDSRCAAANGIGVEVLRLPNGTVELSYQVTGKIGDLRIPPIASPTRRDELWRHTCFEVFIRGPAGPAYYELNFSPSTEWAAYRFSGYRGGMSVAREIAPPRIEVVADAAALKLRATLDLGGLMDMPRDAAWQLGVSAVVEATSGGLSYWALRHPPGKADFHHPDCFALSLPATMSS